MALRSIKSLAKLSFNIIKYYSFFHVTTEYIIPINLIICSGSSMEPTLQSYNLLLAEKTSIRKNLIQK